MGTGPPLTLVATVEMPSSVSKPSTQLRARRMGLNDKLPSGVVGAVEPPKNEPSSVSPLGIGMARLMVGDEGEGAEAMPVPLRYKSSDNDLHNRFCP